MQDLFSIYTVRFELLDTTTKETEENLFGDNLTQDIKDVNIRRKIGNDYGHNRRREYRNNYRSNNYRSNNSYNNDSFFRRGQLVFN